jgi:hypothetical protein
MASWSNSGTPARSGPLAPSLRVGRHAEARELAHRCDESPDISDATVATFITMLGWQRMPQADRTYEWEKPASGAKASQVDALAICLADYRERAHGWPIAFEPCWRPAS